MSARNQSRRWLINLPVGSEDYSKYISANANVRFAIWQVESSPELHLFGYLELLRSTHLSKMCNLFPGAKFNHCDLTQAGFIQYFKCGKNVVHGPWTVGVKASPGKRNDLALPSRSVFRKELSEEKLVRGDPALQYWKYLLKFPPREVDVSQCVQDRRSGKVCKTIPAVPCKPRTVFSMYHSRVYDEDKGYHSF